LNFGHTIWDKIEVLLGTPKGATWEPQGNMMRTCWEHIGNKEEKQKKTPHLPTPKLKKQGSS
jgi:hypothetical protein